MEDHELIILKNHLLESAMSGNWDAVVKMYEQNPRAHYAKITWAGNTALHVAIYAGLEDIVDRLVKVIRDKSDIHKSGSNEQKLVEQKVMPALCTTNKDGNTPLHLAAAMGSVRMCCCIAAVDPALAGLRNKDNHNAIFAAVLHGEKEAFICLHKICDIPSSRAFGYTRGNNGDTILHIALGEEHFDLAFQIIHRYEDLAYCVNEKGLSPLHLLASKPSAFRSGTHLSFLLAIIYHCTYVERLKVASMTQDKRKALKDMYPANYETCIIFVAPIWNAIIIILGKIFMLKRFKDQQPRNFTNASDEYFGRENVPQSSTPVDAENPQELQETEARRKVKDYTGTPFPPNYFVLFEIFKLIMSKTLLLVLGLGTREISKVRAKKERHKWSVQILDKLLECASMYAYEEDGTKPLLPSAASKSDGETDIYNEKPEMKAAEMSRNETVVLIAAKNGITEIIERILVCFPKAIHEMDSEKKNIIHLAVEHRQSRVYELLHKRKITTEMFRMLDNEGNSVLHLSAMLRSEYKPWNIPGEAMQMQWELKWYKYVKDSMPLHFIVPYNKAGKTPKDIFSESHKDLLEKGGKWLTRTSNSCSVVAALIATVAFATVAAVPGGVQSENGKPTLESHPAFYIFAFASLVALCTSVTAVIMFLAILTSRHQERDFRRGLPLKLLAGLTSLFVSIAAMLVSFCAGHFFVLRDVLKYAAIPVYAVTSLPVTFFAAAQFPLYFDLLRATFRGLPQPAYKSVV